MNDIKITKQKITDITNQYLNIFKDEMLAYKEQQAPKKFSANKFGLAKDIDIELRAMLEVPATLDNLLLTKLITDEFKWYTSKEGVRWFGKQYPIFLITDKV